MLLILSICILYKKKRFITGIKKAQYRQKHNKKNKLFDNVDKIKLFQQGTINTNKKHEKSTKGIK